jgi:peroxiredoxin
MKKIIAITIVLAILGSLGYLVANIVRTEKTKKQAAAATQMLPSLGFASANGKPFHNDSLRPGTPTVVYHFAPDCEHCQYEAAEIQKNIQGFAQASLVMVTAADSLAATAFARQYGLMGRHNVHLLLDRQQRFYKTFGTAAVPCFFVYNKSRQLVQKITGEIRIEAVTQLLQ